MAENSSNDNIDVSLTDVLQAHDILLSILLGKTLARSSNPSETINQIMMMVDAQEINPNAKKHIKLLLEPVKATLEE